MSFELSQQLRNSDLVSLLSLPGEWQGKSSQEIGSSLNETLIRLLRLEVSSVTLFDPAGEVTKVFPSHFSAGDLNVIKSTTAQDCVSTIDFPSIGDSKIQVLWTPALGNDGWVAVGSSRQDFPTEHERYVLRSAVDLATLAVRASREAHTQNIRLEAQELVQRESDSVLKQLYAESHAFMTILSVPDFRYLMSNDKHLKLIRKKDIIGKTVREVEPEMEGQGVIDLLRKVAETGEPFVGNEVPIVYAASNGEPEKTNYLDFVYQPLRKIDGTIYAIAAQGYDVTEKVLARKALEGSKRAIENERENFRNLFKQTPEMVCILKGPDHRFEFVNEAHVRVLGFDATGKTVREAQPESVEVHGILDDVYSTGKTAELHEIQVTVGDKHRFFNLTYSARRNDDGVIDGIMILGTEVTDQVLNREELESSHIRYQLLFDSSPLPKLIFDLETLRIIDVNETAVKHYGYSREEFLKLTKADLRAPMEIAQLKESIIRKNEQTDVEVHSGIHHVRKDGSLIDVEISSLDLVLGGREVRLCAIVDVTEKSRLELEQRRLVESLKEAKAEAERANHLKSAFLANMSHEIRTPLGAILGFTDLLRDPGLSREEHSSFINIVTRNGEQLASIINDILDLSKVEAGHLTLESNETSPEQVAADVISLLRVKANEKNVVLEYRPDDSTPETVTTDSLRLKQVLMNIVGNAIKFTQAGSVRVRSYGALDEVTGTGKLYFEVVDTGIGIPADKHEAIFNAFVQADASLSRRFGGTGLGLALSRQLARSLGGDVSVVKSAEGKGTTFLISIADRPEKRAVADEREKKLKGARSIPMNALEGINILVVDDSADNRHLIWRFLSRYGAAVDFAENGLTGYRKALAGNFDVVIMDVQMPEMDGYAATQKLREVGYGKPVIALTAHAMSDVRKKCLNVGYTDHLTKPINSDQLIDTVRRHFLADSRK